ncbi:MAG TPA: hypothetical protein VFZ22_10875 [Pyrinomonadaceae bacterium]|nr:hypothetical protein [Pyrinomonadaceae bacterium]
MSGMTAWLDPLREALDESDTRIDFFFRDDDVGWSNDEFRALLACFRQHSVPLDIAAIPSALTTQFAREIRAAHDEAPELVGIHQHGFSHTNYEVLGRKCEFGVSRRQEDQYEDIQLGKMTLDGMFGFAFDSIFTPPWNRCTKTTAECLNELGFEVLSRDATAPSLRVSGLKELPISIDWFAKKNGKRLSFEFLGTLIARSAKQKQPVGIMLHHELMNAAERELLGDLLALLSTHRQAHCKLMADIAAV